MPDNVQANPGSGGAFFRTFFDGADEWPACVLAWVTGGSAGAWTLQQVTATNGLPVAVLGTIAATQSGAWAVSLAAALPGGTNVIGGVTQSGSWAFSLSAALPSGTNTIGGVELVDSAGVNKVSISSAGAMKVDGSAATQPVSGTVTADQGGLWTVEPGNTANTTPWLFTINAGGNSATVTAAGALKVDGSAVTQPVSGTGTFATSDAADGPVAPGAAATKSVLIGAQYNSSAPAPSNGQQLALQTDASGNLKVNVAAGGASGGTSSSFNAAFPATGTAAGASNGTNMVPLLVDGSGFLKVNVAAGSSGNAAASATGSAVPADADYQGLNVGGTLRGQTGVNPSGVVYAAQCDLTSYNGSTVGAGNALHVQPGTGAVFTVTQTTPANMQAQVQGPAASGSAVSGNPVLLGAVYNTGPTAVASGDIVQLLASAKGALIVTTGTDGFTISTALPAGSNTIGAVTQASGPWTQNLTQVGGSAVALGQTTMANSLPVALASNQSALPVSQSGTWNVGVTGTVPTSPSASTSGGATPYHLVSAASTNATSVKASAGTVYDVQAFNVNASPRYLKFFDKASAPVLGTDAPVKTILMPGNASGAGATATFPVGMAFANGIAIAITAGIADADSTAVGANDCVINFCYK